MQIAEFMTRSPITVNADQSVTNAAKLMRDHDLGSLPVVDSGRLVGFLTDRDIIVRCVANGEDCGRHEVRSVMSPELYCCRDSQTAEEAMSMMAMQQVRRLPVVDAEDRLVGIVNIAQLAEHGTEPSAVCETIKAVRQATGA
jgi:CBS domain-containing protein